MPKSKKKAKKTKKSKIKPKKKAKRKTKKKDPVKDPDILYQDEKFTIRKHWGNTDHFQGILYNVVIEYGLKEKPDLDELNKITTIIYNHIASSRFDDAIGYPVYPNSDYNSAVSRIAREVIKITQKKLEKGETYQDLFSKILKDLDHEEWRWEWDLKTR